MRSVGPGEVIYEGGKLRLLYYGTRGTQHAAPILLVYSLIKRAFILDLQPGSSVVENLTRQGFEVFLTDWLPPNRSDSWRGFDPYVRHDLANAVRAVQSHQDAAQVSIVGYCLGGLLSLLYAALRPNNVKNLVTVNTPVDMAASQGMADWIDEYPLDLLRAIYGNCPRWLLSGFLMMVVPLQRYLDFWFGLSQYNESDQYAETFPAFRQWLDSEVPLAGQLLRELMLDVVKRNALVRGGLKVGDELIDLQRIRSPLLNVVAEFDSVVRPSSSLRLLDMVGSKDKNNLVFPMGHIGIALSDKAHAKLWPQIGRWLQERDN
jgi:polyhydroxyalkanoate synthase